MHQLLRYSIRIIRASYIPLLFTNSYFTEDFLSEIFLNRVKKSSVKSSINKVSSDDSVACIVPYKKFNMKNRFVSSHKRREKKLTVLHKHTRDNTTAVAEKKSRKERELKS